MYNEKVNMQTRVNVTVSTGVVTKEATVVVTAANPNDGHVWTINMNGDIRNMASSQGSASFVFSGTGQMIVSVSDEGGGNAQAQTLDFDAGATVSFTVGSAAPPETPADPTPPTDPTAPPTDPVVPPEGGGEVMP